MKSLGMVRWFNPTSGEYEIRVESDNGHYKSFVRPCDAADQQVYDNLRVAAERLKAKLQR